jgi:hypothetical protein
MIGAGVGALAVASLLFRAPAWMAALAWANVAALSVHVVGGLLLCKVPARTFLAFLYAPAFVAWKCTLYISAMQQKARTWEPTRRSSL